MTETNAGCALVVDDDALIRMDAVDICGDAGFEVLDAANTARLSRF